MNLGAWIHPAWDLSGLEPLIVTSKNAYALVADWLIISALSKYFQKECSHINYQQCNKKKLFKFFCFLQQNVYIIGLCWLEYLVDLVVEINLKDGAHWAQYFYFL